MKRRVALSLAGALLWTGLCSAEKAPAAAPKGKARPDGAVLEAAFEDLLTDPESPLERPRADQRQILVSTEPLVSKPSLDTVLQRHDVKQWAKLSPAQLSLTQVAAKEIVQRAAAGERFQNFGPQDPRIILYPKAEDEKAALDKDALKRLRRPQVFRAYPPGYSEDGMLAVVHLAFPWSGGRHSGNATVVLARQGDKWSVLMRQYLLYV